MNSSIKKVSIIGCGYVGSSIAYALMMKELPDEIVLIDKDKSITDAEMLDIRHGIPYMGTCKIISGDYTDIKDSDLIVITAGRNRKPNESRLDLAQDNTRIGHVIAQEIRKYYELKNMLLVGEMITRACLTRKESRGSHYREDYPESSDEWLKFIKIYKDHDDMAVSVL